MDNPRRIDFAPFALDLVNECLWRGSDQIKLRPKAFAVLEHLVARPSQLVTKEELITAVWRDTFVGDAVLKVAIRQIRDALDDDPKAPRFIETAHRRGYRFIGARASAALTPPLDGTAVVGRDQALAQMHAWLAGARNGERQVVFVTGEAGIGKTTLLDAFLRTLHADTGVRICSGHCLEQYGMGEAYLPVLEAIRQLCRDHAAAIAVLRSHAPVWLLQMPSLMTPADREALARETTGGTHERMLREMADALEALSADTPLILRLEDLHWSDVSTLDLISYVARRRSAAHLMIVGTFRPAELIATGHPLKNVQRELLSRRLCEELPLDYLSEAAVAQHLTARFPGSTFPPDLPALIHERTEGNPLFMVNFVDYLVDERLVEAGAGGWRLRAAVDTFKIGVPDSIRHLIETQIDRLTADEQRLLEAASAIGAEFSVAAAAAALGDPIADLELRCERLGRRHQFIREAGTQPLPDGRQVGRYAFVHAVHRHVLYERISPARRMILHHRIGEGAEAVYGAMTETFAAELAMHFERAADYSRATDYLHQAARNALDRSAYREAIALSRHALELIARLPDSVERARLELRIRLMLGIPLITTEGYAAASVGLEYERARILCDRIGSTPETAQVLWGLWTFRALKADLSGALGIASEMLRRAEQLPDAGMALRGHWAMEITSTHRGEFALALDHGERALALYDADPRCDDRFSAPLDAGVTVRCFAAWVLWFSGFPDQARRRIGEAVRRARALAEPHGLAHALVFAAVVYQLCRELPLAQEYAEQAIDLSAEHGLVLYQAMATLLAGWAAPGLRGSAGIDQIRRGLAAWDATGARLMKPHFLALLAETLGASGESHTAIAALDEALSHAHRTGERCYEAELHRLKGVHILQGADGARRDAEALACFEAALAIADRQGALSLSLRAASDLARLHVSRARPDLACALLLPIHSRFTEGFDTADLRDARILLDAAAAR